MANKSLYKQYKVAIRKDKISKNKHVTPKATPAEKRHADIINRRRANWS